MNQLQVPSCSHGTSNMLEKVVHHVSSDFSSIQRASSAGVVHAGLDSFAALSIMSHVSHLADLGHTVVCTVHQPRSAIWAMFSQAGARLPNEHTD